jgi:hypothetical protein
MRQCSLVLLALPPSVLVCSLLATPVQAQFTQQGLKLVGSNASGSPVLQGYSVALSDDGNTAIVGGENDHGGIGAAWVWVRSRGVWKLCARSSANRSWEADWLSSDQS